MTLVVALVWIAVTALAARHKLQEAQAELPKLREALVSGQLSEARALSDDIRSNAASAHALVSGPAWWVAANLPGVRTPFVTSRTIATAAHAIGNNVLPGIVQLGATIRDSSLHSGTTVHLAPLVAADPVVTAASAASARALALVEATDKTSWLSSVDRSRASLVNQLTTLDGELSGASRALHTALPMMGEDGLRRYFIGFENESEARGLGGLPGAFAIVTVDHGSFAFTHFGNDTQFNGITADVNLGADYNARYDTANPTGLYVNSDIGPDFRDAAQIWAGMWQKVSGQHVDGAIAVDPTALSYLLQVTGPAPLAGGGQVTAANVVALTEQEQYSKFSNIPERKKYVVAVSKAISKRVTSGAGSATSLIKAIGRGARERRLDFWSSHASEEKSLIAAGYGAVLQDTAGAPFTGFTVVNGAGSKLDYYLDRTMTYSRTSCAANTSATATFTLKNDAPRSGLPAYVVVREDRPKYRTRPGDNYDILTYYGTPGAQVTSATVDGKTVAVGVGREHGLTTVSFGLEIPVQATRTVSLTIREPAADTSVQVLRQPLVRPAQINITEPACT